MVAGNLLPLVFYLSLLTNLVMDLAGRGQETRPGGEGGTENVKSYGEWVADEKNIEIGENYPSFVLSLKPSILKNISQSSEYDNNVSYEDIQDDVDFVNKRPSIIFSGIESVKMRRNQSMYKEVSAPL